MQNSTLPSSKLNFEQQKAINAIDGTYLVVAGAGTGKTTVVVERINKLLGSGVDSKRILALTFTEKATAEMIDRVDTVSNALNIELPILTFNGYGESMLRQYGSDIGLDRGFSVLNDTSKVVFLSERFDELELDYYAPISNPDGLLKDLTSYFSRLKQSVITPDIYNKYVKKLTADDESEQLNKNKHQELARAYDKYIQLCKQSNKIDYDDQIYLFLELLETRPNIRKEVQARYDFVMVDEFQDTNKMQSDMIDLIISEKQNLFVVGDDDQSIYGWRGATLANILDFKERYPKSGEVTLIKNYRSTTEILDTAYKLIQHNNPHRLETRLKINKKLTSTTHGDKPTVFEFENLKDELDWVAKDIKKYIDDGVAGGDIAVLSRRNETIKALSEHLDMLDIDHSLIGQSYNVYKEPAVRTILEALNTIVNTHDNKSLYHTLCGPLFNIPIEPLARLSSRSKLEHSILFVSIKESTSKDLSAARNALKMIEDWRQLSTMHSVGILAYQILDKSGYRERLINAVSTDPTLVNTTRGISELFRTMKDFEKISINPTAIYYMDALPALTSAGDLKDDGTLEISNDKPSLMTIHKSKGLEWPIVYIIDCTEGSFPLKSFGGGITIPDDISGSVSNEADQAICEERRLMYVAMTRAAEKLKLSYSLRHYSTAMRKPSRFIAEAFGSNFAAQKLVSEAKGESFENPIITQKQLSTPADILKNDVVNLSVSQVSKYLECPLDFYFKYILKVPSEYNPSQQYGTIIHAILDEINKSLINNVEVPLEKLRETLAREWPKSGYMTVNHRDRSFKQASETLDSVYSRYLSSPRVPIASEEPFRINLRDIGLTMAGRYDAVFPLNNGVEIVDYKTTTRVDTPKRAKQRAGSSVQLTLYALAWQETHGELPELLTLDFIDTGQKGSIRKTTKGIETARLRLKDVADGIRSNTFRPGKDHKYCIHPDLSK